LLGHQNHKQKIKYLVQIKEENVRCKEQIAKLELENAKQVTHGRPIEISMGHSTFIQDFYGTLDIYPRFLWDTGHLSKIYMGHLTFIQDFYGTLDIYQRFIWDT
jgi:hypothetical protein